ncbi:hypothetical protein LPY66_10645 [Dehalobacter sp. DCM]|uniref:hypothetical protein n=1 Tax=Dehalobacter sp. DCM TaxID=2907827 RepID=UPI0030812E71|nr:hypothetical protein LPY66_10645 [Dehalobacter sp. DCM]
MSNVSRMTKHSTAKRDCDGHGWPNVADTMEGVGAAKPWMAQKGLIGPFCCRKRNCGTQTIPRHFFLHTILFT